MKEIVSAAARDLGPAGRSRLEAGIDPATLALARRFDPAVHADLWNRRGPWARLELAQAPSLPLRPLDLAEARKLNAVMPSGLDADGSSAPFRLKAGGAERARALLCLTQAIYYEAALEPPEGQAAVAQTVLNRVRHPLFPKSVCGVVYEGASRPGCQFSFACDGSRQRPPIAPFWQRAEAVAKAALDGFVDRAVGSAVYYHADYVFPTWASEMFKIRKVGTHIFYRFPGAEAPTARYLGGELRVSMAGPPHMAPPEAQPLAPSPGRRPEALLTVASAASEGPRTRAAMQILAIPPAGPAVGAGQLSTGLQSVARTPPGRSGGYVPGGPGAPAHAATGS